MFPKLSDLKVGDQLIADAGFSCVQEDEVVTVKSDPEGHLYVDCRRGRHYLSWRTDKHDTVVGLRRLKGAYDDNTPVS